jgi:hypothetical protein
MQWLHVGLLVVQRAMAVLTKLLHCAVAASAEIYYASCSFRQ